MGLFKERIWSFFHKKKPSEHAMHANRSADLSLQTARRDLARVQNGYEESQRVAQRIREHNVANHYDDWLSEQFLRYYKS